VAEKKSVSERRRLLMRCGGAGYFNPPQGVGLIAPLTKLDRLSFDRSIENILSIN
jgi:hypothetical protein